MANKRKYPEVVGYWVYSLYVPSVNKFYVGVSKRKECWQRWVKSQYKGTALEPFLNEWDNLIKTVLIDGLTKEQAYQYEGKIIDALSMNDLCINKRCSGLIYVSNVNAYQREWKENNKEKVREYGKQYRENNKEKIHQQQKQYYENNKEKEQERKKQWSKDNPDYFKQYREDNKEKINQRRRQQRLKKKLEKQQQQQTVVH